MSAVKRGKKTAARGGRSLTLYASIASQFFALLRNVIVARLLGPEEFGVAAMIILTISFLDSFANAGSHNLLVQAKDEDGGPLLAAAHAVTLGRGASTAILLMLVAGPIAALFDVNISPAAFYVLAVSALISGFAHRGVRLVQREGNFRPDSITQVSADFASLAVAVPVAMLTHSHLAIVAGLLGRSVVNVAVSHYLAPQRYLLSWDKRYLRRFWVFGWPLMINGPLLFFSSQADRLFISYELGASALGVYSAVLVLVMSPSTAILRWMGTIYMPSLAKFFHKNGNLEERGVVYDYTVLMLLFALAMLVGFATIGGVAVHVLYGPRFSTPTFLIALIGCLQIVRFLRAWPSTLALSAAASGGILVATMVRLAALPIGYLGVVIVGGLPGLIGGFIVGEALALLVNLLIINRNALRPLRAGMAPILAFFVIAAAVVGAVWLSGDSWILLATMFVVAMGLGAPALAASISPSEMTAAYGRARAWVAKRIGDRGPGGT